MRTRQNEVLSAARRQVDNTASYNKLHKITQEQIQNLVTELSVAITRIDNLYRQNKLFGEKVKKLNDQVEFLQGLVMDNWGEDVPAHVHLPEDYEQAWNKIP